MKNEKEATTELKLLLEDMAKRGIKIKNKANSWFKLGPRFTTTLGKTIFVPKDWDTYSDLDKLSTLVHENIHIHQYSKFTVPGFLFLYLLCFFPIGLAFFRYLFERQAYLVGYKKILEYRITAKSMLINNGVEQMCKGNYGYAWIFPKAVRKWFEKNLG